MFAPPTDPSAVRRIILVGDQQRTFWFERVIGRKQNDAARRRIVEAVAQESPDLVVLLGDQVFCGALASDWRRYDRLVAPWREAGLSVCCVAGNHDYYLNPKRGRKHLRSRFENQRESPWFRIEMGELLLIGLDSNQWVLGRRRWKEQMDWFADRLAGARARPEIRGVLVCLHHPPFTNCRIGWDREELHEALLPEFLSTRKTLAMVSGHTHAFERFEKGEKTYLVCGGGGGFRMSLLEGADQRHRDRCTLPCPRPFHYVKIDRKDDGLHFGIWGFDGVEDPLRLIDQFCLDYPKLGGSSKRPSGEGENSSTA